MTIQYSVAVSPSGQAGTGIKLFATNGADTVLYTADTVTERTNAKGQYLATFDESSVIPAGNYTQIHFSSTGIPLSIGDRTFAGTDGETATARGAELDSAIASQIATIAAVLGSAMRGERTHSQALDLILAATVGKSSQPSGTTEKFKFLDDADAFTTTFDANGNRTAVALS